jgi:enoyl-CoA hydratase
MTGSIRRDDIGDGIVRLTIDHQAKLNALNNAMWDQLGDFMRELDGDESLRCIIITGAGDKAFAVGADISEFEENRSSVEKARVYAKRTHGALAALSECRHPVIAAINGLCVGGGLEIACCADLRIATESSRFGIPVKRLGLVVAHDEMRALLHLVGKSNTLRILLEGDVFGADEALRMGLVNRVVPAPEFDAAVMKSAGLIAEGAPLVARWHKKFANRLMDPEPLTPEEKDESFTCFGTEDFATGYQAFLEKRQPRFAGR